MKISRAYPPMYKEILAVFPNASAHGVIFCWGDTIHNPSNISLPRSLHMHEEVHHAQQTDDEERIRFWWRTYLDSPEWRFAQELPAHIAEYKAYRASRHGYSRAGFLNVLAERLSGPLYNNVISYHDAAQSILKGAA